MSTRSTKVARLALVFMTVSLPGCRLLDVVFHPGGESVFRVRGRLIPSESAKDCVLELFESGSWTASQRRQIGPDFQQTFVIGPGFHKYYMVVTCEGPWLPHKTQEFELGGSRNFSDPIDLGTITLVKK